MTTSAVAVGVTLVAPVLVGWTATTCVLLGFAQVAQTSGSFNLLLAQHWTTQQTIFFLIKEWKHKEFSP